MYSLLMYASLGFKSTFLDPLCVTAAGAGIFRLGSGKGLFLRGGRHASDNISAGGCGHQQDARSRPKEGLLRRSQAPSRSARAGESSCLSINLPLLRQTLVLLEESRSSYCKSSAVSSIRSSRGLASTLHHSLYLANVQKGKSIFENDHCPEDHCHG